MWGRVSGSGPSCYPAMGHPEDKEPPWVLLHASPSLTCLREGHVLRERLENFQKDPRMYPPWNVPSPSLTHVGAGLWLWGVGVNREVKPSRLPGRFLTPFFLEPPSPTCPVASPPEPGPRGTLCWWNRAWERGNEACPDGMGWATW